MAVGKSNSLGTVHVPRALLEPERKATPLLGMEEGVCVIVPPLLFLYIGVLGGEMNHLAPASS